MPRRGGVTRSNLIAATTRVVSEVGYAHATTKAIAQAAGVSEGTIYRHFSDKAELFFAAVMERNAAVVEGLSTFPDRAGSGTVVGNLVNALTTLAGLRADIVPLELALLSDPEMAAVRHRARAGATGDVPQPFLTLYLQAEQRLGRVRPEVAAEQAEMVLLATLLGLALTPAPDGAAVDQALLEAAVRAFVEGIGEPDGP